MEKKENTEDKGKGWHGEPKRHSEVALKCKRKSAELCKVESTKPTVKPVLETQKPTLSMKEDKTEESEDSPSIIFHQPLKNRYHSVTRKQLINFVKQYSHLCKGLNEIRITNPSYNRLSWQYLAYGQYLRTRRTIKIYSQPTNEPKITSSFMLNEVLLHELGHLRSHNQSKIWKRLITKPKDKNFRNAEEEYAEKFKDKVLNGR